MTKDSTPEIPAIISKFLQEITRLDAAQNRINDKLSELDQLTDETVDSQALGGDEAIGVRKFLLQLRLDTIDTIVAMLKLNKSLCDSVGIDKLHTYQHNFERLLYALKEDTLWHETQEMVGLLKKLEKGNVLLEKAKKQQEQERRLLRRILNRLKKFGKLSSEEMSEDLFQYEEGEAELIAARLAKDFRDPKTRKTIRGMEGVFLSVAELQANFQFSVEQLAQAMHHYEGLPEFGLFFNHIATLEGPVSRFFQANQTGIGLLQAISKKISNQFRAEASLKQNIQLLNNLSTRVANTNALHEKLVGGNQNHLRQLRHIANQLSPEVPSKSPAPGTAEQLSPGPKMGPKPY